MNSINAPNTEVEDFYLTDPESYTDPDWTKPDALTGPEPIVSILSADSCLVEEYEITFTSYEDIKKKLNDYISEKVVSQELPDSYIVKGRINLYMIKPVLDNPTKFIVSAYTYDKVRYGCSFWNYVEYEFDLLCQYLDRNDQMEENDITITDIEDTSEVLEGEDYFDKQYEEYLQINPVHEGAGEDDDENDWSSLGPATAESAARSNEILSAYKNNNELDNLIEVIRIQFSDKNNETEEKVPLINVDKSI